MKEKIKICQSCGMPMIKDPQGGGTNRNGSKNDTYCSYCYKKGEFTFQGTKEEFKQLCRGMLLKSGNSKLTAWFFTRNLGRLDRWKNQ